MRHVAETQETCFLLALRRGDAEWLLSGPWESGVLPSPGVGRRESGVLPHPDGRLSPCLTPRHRGQEIFFGGGRLSTGARLPVSGRFFHTGT